MKLSRNSSPLISSIWTICFSFLAVTAEAQFEITHIDSEASEELILYTQSFEKQTYLLNKCGEIINIWNHENRSGLSGRFLDDGNLIRAEFVPNSCCTQASAGGLLQIVDWRNNTIWDHLVANETETQHHDFTVLPNGNIMYLGWEVLDTSEQQKLGITDIESSLWSEFIREVKPINSEEYELVWEWRLKHHLIQDQFPDRSNYTTSIKSNLGKIDVNYIGPSSYNNRHRWHVNSLEYNSKRDEVIVNSRESGEIWVIDHSTSIEEARSNFGGVHNKGGQLLFRWGNPAAYGRGRDDSFELFGAHGLAWLESDTSYQDYILFFNNGAGRPSGNYSTVEVIKPQLSAEGLYELGADSTYFLEDHQIIYGDDQSLNPLQSMFLSNAEKLETGFLINEGSNGRVFEINREKEIVWELVVNSGQRDIFKAHSYPLTFPGFRGKSMTPIDSENIATEFDQCNDLVMSINKDEKLLQVNPNPATKEIHLTARDQFELIVFDLNGETMWKKKHQSGTSQVDIQHLNPGVYLFHIATGRSSRVYRIIKI